VLHDLHLRAHVVVSGDESKQARQLANTPSSRPPKLWPHYALVWDTETTIDLEQRLNFGVWRFCKLQDGKYVSLQEGIFHCDGLPAKDRQTIRTHVRKNVADGLGPKADSQLVMLSRAEFVERVFWESVRNSTHSQCVLAARGATPRLPSETSSGKLLINALTGKVGSGTLDAGGLPPGVNPA
jgi:hypothetical protein